MSLLYRRVLATATMTSSALLLLLLQSCRTDTEYGLVQSLTFLQGTTRSTCTRKPWKTTICHASRSSTKPNRRNMLGHDRFDDDEEYDDDDDDFSEDSDDFLNLLMVDMENQEMDFSPQRNRGSSLAMRLTDDDDDDKEQEKEEQDYDVDEEEESEELVAEVEELFEFLDMLNDSPVGSLGLEELNLVRETIESIADMSYQPLSSSSSSYEYDTTTTPKATTLDVSLARAAEDLLRRLVAEWQSRDKYDEKTLWQPCDNDFWNVYRAWEAVLGRTNNAGGDNTINTDALPLVIDQTFQLYNLQQSLVVQQQQQLTAVAPSVASLETVLGILATSRERGADRKVMTVFNDIAETDRTATMYSIAIRSMAKARDRGAANRAEMLLRQAVGTFPPAMVDGKPVGMTIDSFNSVIVAWAKSGLDYGPERAEKLIVFMDETDKNYGSLGLVSPNIFSFTSLMDAYTQQGDWDGASAADRILKNLLDQYLEGIEGITEPSVASWTIVIGAWSRLSKKGFKGAASRAGKLLSFLEQLSKEGKIGFRPDSIVYNTCLNAYANSKGHDGPAKAEEILDRMNDMYYLDGDETMRPSARSIRIVLDSWVRSNDTNAMDDAELLLERYEDHLFSLGPPNEPPEVLDEIRDVYRTMLFGWAKKGSPVQAQHYLQTMINKGMKPDNMCYDKVIESNTLLKQDDTNDHSKAFARSYQVFELLEQQRKAGNVSPNERVFTSFIRAMTKARIPRLASKARLILKRMQDLYEKDGNQHIQPTVFAYNAVLMVCAESTGTEEDQEEAFRIAVEVFNELRTSETTKQEPDHVSFGNMLRCANLLPNGKQKDGVIKSTFSLCCRAGFVNDFVLRDLRLAASDDLFYSLLRLPATASAAVTSEDLPREWRYRFDSRKRKPAAPRHS